MKLIIRDDGSLDGVDEIPVKVMAKVGKITNFIPPRRDGCAGGNPLSTKPAKLIIQLFAQPVSGVTEPCIIGGYRLVQGPGQWI